MTNNIKTYLLLTTSASITYLAIYLGWENRLSRIALTFAALTTAYLAGRIKQ